MRNSKRYLFRPLVPLLLSLSLLAISCNKDDAQQLRSENQDLKNRLAALEQTKQDTAESHYQKGTELLAANNLPSAKKEFEIVTDRFPNSPLVTDATVKIININSTLNQEGKGKSTSTEKTKPFPDASAQSKNQKKENDIDESVPLTGSDWYIFGPQGQCVQQSPAEFMNMMKNDSITMRVTSRRKDTVTLHSPTVNKDFMFIKGESDCELMARMVTGH